MSTVLFVENIICTGILGVYPEERERAQECIISIEASVDAAPPQHDALEETLDYGHFVRIAREVVEHGQYTLVETIAEEIARRVLALPHVVSTTVSVTKTKPYAPARAGVRISRERTV